MTVPKGWRSRKLTYIDLIAILEGCVKERNALLAALRKIAECGEPQSAPLARQAIEDAGEVSSQ